MIHTKITKEFLEGILGFEIEGFTVDYYGINVYGQLKNPLKQVKVRENLPNDSKRVKDGVTVWSVMRNYINSLPTWASVTRQELLKEVDKNVERYSPATVDHYRRMLTVVGYLTYDLKHKPPREGHYTVVTHIDERMTSSSLRRRYDTGDF